MDSTTLRAALDWVWNFSPVLLGAGGGYAFYRFIGCQSGACPITRNPWLSTLYGALLGAMLAYR